MPPFGGGTTVPNVFTVINGVLFTIGAVLVALGLRYAWRARLLDRFLTVNLS
jgi:hypothetical protein